MDSKRMTVIAISIIYMTVFIVFILLGVEEKQLNQLHYILPLINKTHHG